ncbi:maltose operon transcriptional repressor MalR LacI family [Vibrio astriarenae]|nr:maltose operon transcriptional repressor MalR LacI family [Vibrio sp. C7]
MKKKKAPTVYDVAKLAGVSPSTVSRFLNRTTYVSDEKSEKLEQAIKELGYKPNQHSTTHSNRRSMTIGVLIQHPDSPFTCRILNDMEKTLIAKGYSLVIATGHWQKNLEQHALDYLAKSNVDGVLLSLVTLKKRPSSSSLTTSPLWPWVIKLRQRMFVASTSITRWVVTSPHCIYCSKVM